MPNPPRLKLLSESTRGLTATHVTACLCWTYC